MEAYDEAEVCELVGIFDHLRSTTKNVFALNRDDRFAVLKNKSVL